MSVIDPRIIKKTQTTLGKFVKKPPLTEKLLSKPPFRFLHDVFVTLNKDTGVFNGLFTPEELKSENVKDKEGKIAFLEKIIDVIAFASGENLAARPSKIVAGHEADRTNEVLQALGKIVEKQINTEEFVARVLSGEKPPKSNKSTSKKSTGPEKSKQEGKSSKNLKEEREYKPKHGGPQNKPKNKSPEKLKSEAHGAKKKSAKSSANQVETIQSVATSEKFPVSATKVADQDDEIEVESQQKDENNEIEEVQVPVPISRPTTAAHLFPQEINDQVSTESLAVLDKELEGDKTANIPEVQELSSRSQENISELSKLISSPGEMNLVDNMDGGDVDPLLNLDSNNGLPSSIIRPSTGMQRPNRPRTGVRSARPPSARPAPPKVRERFEAPPEPLSRPTTGKITSNVIIDANKDEDADEEYIIQERSNNEEFVSNITNDDAEGKPEESTGLLINQIMETKSDYEKQAIEDKSYDKIEIERSTTTEANRLKEREQRSVELQNLRSSIQLLTRSANPLGKMMDYLLEDMDSMEKEKEQWQQENHSLVNQLQKEKSETDNLVRPLVSMLTELEAAVRQENDKISVTKANILRNTEKIHRLLANMGAGHRI